MSPMKLKRVLSTVCLFVGFATDELRLEEYFCQPEFKANEHLRNLKFVHLRGLTVPNDTGTPLDEMYAKAVSRLALAMPHVRYVSLSAEYEYSADDATDSFELKTELHHMRRWVDVIIAEFYSHRIQILEFELFASFGFISLREAVNETFGQEHALDLEFCSLSFACDIRIPLKFSDGEFLLSAELDDHLSRRVTGRRAGQGRRVSCELYKPEDTSFSANQLQAYEFVSGSLDVGRLQSKKTYFLDLPVERADRKSIQRLYDQMVRNFRRQLPNVETVKLRAQTYFVPHNTLSEAELKTQLRYLKRWAQIVVDAFRRKDVEVQSFDLIAVMKFKHTIPLASLFNSAFNTVKDAEIKPHLSRNLYNAQIPLSGRLKMQAEILLNGDLVSTTSNGSRKKSFFTLGESPPRAFLSR